MSFQTTSDHPGFPADAATPLGTAPTPRNGAEASHPTALAVAASEAGYRFNGVPVEGITPVGGWALFSYEEDDGDGFTTLGYIARGADLDVMLGLSRFRFTPTQARFAWLVRNSFPRAMVRPGGACSPLDNNDIDAAIAAELGRAAA